MSVSRWLDVEVTKDDVEINTLPSNIALADLQNDNDYKLLIGDMTMGADKNPMMKIFKGTALMSEMILPDIPTAVMSFYTNETMPRSHPVVAIALCSSVYIYKNMKLFYKYHLPAMDLHQTELDIWRQMTEHNNSEERINSCVEKMKTVPYNLLSPQSQELISLNAEKYSSFVKCNSDYPINKTSVVTCMTTLNINSVDRYGVACLVIGTEHGDLIFLDPQTFTQLHHAKVCQSKFTPSQLVATGLYDVDYRIIIATREKAICLLKREWLEGKVLMNLPAAVVSVEVMPSDCSIIVICMDKSMHCYNKKGKKQWVVEFEHYPITTTLIPVTHLGTTLIGVAFKSGHLHIYNGKTQVDAIFVKDGVSVMKFGQMGQEEHVMIIITMEGSLLLKILKRTADFDLTSSGGSDFNQTQTSSAAAQQARPLVVPKKSRLYLEQALRERENAVAIHNTFQQDLNRLRLTVGKTLLDAHLKSENSVAAGSMESLRLSAEVNGLGPVFKVVLCLENQSSDNAVMNLSILFHVNVENYKVAQPHFKVPMIVPGGKIRFPTQVEEMFPEGDNGINPEVLLGHITGQAGSRSNIRVLLLKEGRSQPLSAAVVRMPPTDPMMLPQRLMQTANYI